jgi:hypothetical protein
MQSQANHLHLARRGLLQFARRTRASKGNVCLRVLGAGNNVMIASNALHVTLTAENAINYANLLLIRLCMLWKMISVLCFLVAWMLSQAKSCGLSNC